MALASKSWLALSPAVQEVIVWSVVILAIFLVGAYVLMYWLRHRLLSDEPDRGAGLSIESLEELHRRGELTDEEFRRLRKSVLGLDEADRSRHNQAARPDAGSAQGNPAARRGTDGEITQSDRETDRNDPEQKKER